MRPNRQVKIISSQIEHYQDLKKQLENLTDEITQIISSGQSWIDETDTTQSFEKMNHFLTSEINNCLQKCLNIANGDDVKSNYNYKDNIPDDRHFHQIKFKFDEIDKWMTKHSTKLRDLKQILKRHEKQSEIISSRCAEIDKKTEVKLDEIMRELHAASDFMSTLQSKTEIMTNEKFTSETKWDGVLGKLSDQDEKIQDITAKQESDRAKNVAIKDDLARNLDKVTNEVALLSKDLKEMILLNSASKKISFSVGLTTGTLVPHGSVVKYDKVITNIGECYRLSTGIFTCPLNGLYYFHVGIMSNEHKPVDIGLYQNDVYKITFYAHNENSFGSSGNATVLQLKQNDQVYLKSIINSELHGFAPYSCNTFSGFLLAAE